MKPTRNQRTIDVSGLPDEVIVAVETLVEILRTKESDKEAPPLAARVSWSETLRAWAASHRHLDRLADDSRESIYEGRGE